VVRGYAPVFSYCETCIDGRPARSSFGSSLLSGFDMHPSITEVGCGDWDRNAWIA
jgi:hypothetical protein